ncbi:MAG: hypothetical protein ABFD49_06640 [Armatimonadota bacterium]|nr:hypothetical protein [bacterium]
MNDFCLAVLLVAVLAQPSFSETVFKDSFDSGSSSIWGNERGSWYVHDGVYDTYYPGNSPTTVSLLSANLADFIVDVDVNSVSDGGIWLRSNYTNGSISGVLLVTGGHQRSGTGFYWHTVHNDGYSSMLNESGAMFGQGGNIHIRVVVSGDTYSCYFNGSATPCTILTTSDFSSGQVGLYDFSGQTFDNVSIQTSDSVATKIGSAFDPIMETASKNFRYTFFGKVTKYDANSFWLDDGSAQSIKVYSPEYSGLANGDFVRATGIVGYASGEPILNAGSWAIID